MPENSVKTRCLVIPDRGSEPPHSLMTRGEDLGWAPVIQSDPYLALAELLLEGRGRSSRVDWGLPSVNKRTILMLAQSSRPPWRRDFLDAVHRFLPHTHVYGWENEELFLLLDPGPEVIASAIADIPSPSPEFRTSPPPLRLAPSTPPGSAPPVSDCLVTAGVETEAASGEDEDEQNLAITREEIDMLLESTTPETPDSPGFAEHKP